MIMDELNFELVEWLNGRNLEDKQHEAMQLLTVSPEGWAHQAMVSVGEVVALGPDRIRLALWPGTQTSQNMHRTGKAGLVLVLNGELIHIKLEVEPLPPLEDARHPRDRFEAKITQVKVDAAPYAVLTSGITFDLKNVDEGVSRWKETVEELRQ